MATLTTHLRSPESHGRLTFRPDCPICRQSRLTGTLNAERIVSLRAQAVLTASMLAISAAAPVTSALAAEPDQEQKGTAPVTQAGAPEPAANPDFDPGGDSTSLPDTGPPSPPAAASGDDDTAAVEPDPTTNPTEPLVDTGDGSDTTAELAPPAAKGPPVPTSPEPPQSPGPASPATTVAPPVPTPTAAPEPTTPAPTLAGSGQPEPQPRQSDSVNDQDAIRSPRRAPAESSTSRAGTVSAPDVVPAALRGAPTPAVGSSEPAKPGDRRHTVRPGESLWAIAADVLGPDATPAQIAREVHRLWALNSDRIGTGDPDLLMIGTRLVLR